MRDDKRELRRVGSLVCKKGLSLPRSSGSTGVACRYTSSFCLFHQHSACLLRSMARIGEEICCNVCWTCPSWQRKSRVLQYSQPSTISTQAGTCRANIATVHIDQITKACTCKLCIGRMGSSVLACCSMSCPCQRCSKVFCGVIELDVSGRISLIATALQFIYEAKCSNAWECA